ncbi:MAG: hypothetical protein DRO52_00865 [Candidatus Hecatellales archaeon]|nr:MAG: hypothetical protein DRO52_00865 [Candidatus Hecatellales archaeon]
MSECEDKLDYLRNLLTPLIGRTLKAVHEYFGDEGLNKIAEVWKEARIKAAPTMMERAGVKEDERNCIGVAKILDYNDKNYYGIEGEWKELTPERGVKIVTKCAIAKNLNWEVCNVCFREAARGIGIVVTGNPKFKVEVPKSIAAGDDVCEVIIENKKD